MNTLIFLCVFTYLLFVAWVTVEAIKRYGKDAVQELGIGCAVSCFLCMLPIPIMADLGIIK